MICRIPLRNVKDMLLNQISNNYFKSIEDEMIITRNMANILERFEKTISNIDNKYYYIINDEGQREPYFDPLHTCQWLMFLYIAAKIVCDKIYGQSKTVSGCDLYYEVEMPEKFSFDHPTGSFMGRAKYGDYFSFTQGCTVGHFNEIYPVIGENVTMLTGSKILGNSHIGDNCIISDGTVIRDQNIPNNSIVTGKSPNLVIKPR